MVHYSLVMVLCLNFMLFRVSRRSRACDARARALFFVRFRTVQYESNKISRFYALTPKITYLGQFSNCMVRRSRNLMIWLMAVDTIVDVAVVLHGVVDVAVNMAVDMAAATSGYGCGRCRGVCISMTIKYGIKHM